MKADRVVDLENFFGADAKACAGASVVVIGIWNERVQTVVAASHLQNDKDSAVTAGGDLGGVVGGIRLEGRKCVREESGNGPCNGRAKRGSAQKFAPSFE